MTILGRSIALLMLLACSGCMTDQLMSPSSSSARSGQANITISRTDDVTYMAAAANVELNGKPFATLAFGRSYTALLPPGSAVLKVSAWTGPAGLANNRLPAGSTSYRFNVEAGKSYSFVISPRMVPVTRDVTAANGEATEGGGGPFVIAAAQ